MLEGRVRARESLGHTWQGIDWICCRTSAWVQRTARFWEKTTWEREWISTWSYHKSILACQKDDALTQICKLRHREGLAEWNGWRSWCRRGCRVGTRWKDARQEKDCLKILWTGHQGWFTQQGRSGYWPRQAYRWRSYRCIGSQSRLEAK